MKSTPPRDLRPAERPRSTAAAESPSILLSAGEPSGDLHGAAVARALRERWPQARLWGLGGPRMAAEGVELIAGLDRLAVMGFSEVLTHLPFLIRLSRTLAREMELRGTALVLPIDYPGFNLRLARAAHRRGVPVLYYIAPQVWAWHRSRAARLAEHSDRLAVILPFEAELFREHGARVSFVGHPLAEPVAAGDRGAFCRELGVDPERPILALFPGSRAQEIARHLPLFLDAADLVRRRRRDVQPVLAASPTLEPGLYTGSPWPSTAESRQLLRHARAALVKSGTGTLEAAVAETPMVIAYRTSPATFWLARRLVRVEHIGLVNLVAGERVAPEFIQDDATPAALAEALDPLLAEGSAEHRAMRQRLSVVRERLAPPEPDGRGAAARVADLAAELLEAS